MTDKQKRTIKQQLDHQVDEMKLTKYGFRLDLLGFSSFLSVLGIVVSIIGIIGGIAFFVLGSTTPRSRDWGYLTRNTFYVFGGLLLVLLTPYIILWILLKIKTSKQDIHGIERIGKVYSYLSGSLEVIGEIALIIFSIFGIVGFKHLLGWWIGCIIGSAIYFIFACLKIHGIRVENNKLLGTYLGFRYVLFIIYMVAHIVLSVHLYRANRQVAVAAPFTGIVLFILDIGLTVILHSIRVDRENTAGTENPMKNF